MCVHVFVFCIDRFTTNKSLDLLTCVVNRILFGCMSTEIWTEQKLLQTNAVQPDNTDNSSGVAVDVKVSELCKKLF